MFGYRKLLEKIEELEEKIKDKEFKACEECGVVYQKDKLKKVEDVFVSRNYYPNYGTSRDVKEKYYCKKHAPKYSKSVSSVSSHIMRYYTSEQEVDENGKIL